jgi:hypothetical protein
MNKALGKLLAASVICALPAVACHREDTRESLRDYLTSLAEQKAQRSFDTTTVRIVEEWATAVPGLLYHWGVGSRADAHDPGWNVLAGTYRGRRADLSSPRDWWGLVTGSDSAPDLRIDARGACEDVIQYVGPGADFRARPIVYWHARPVEELTALWPWAETTLKKANLQKAIVSWPSDSVTVWTVWSLEIDRAARYRCSVWSDSLQLVLMDSLAYDSLEVRLLPWVLRPSKLTDNREVLKRRERP